jgi:hypothetical protein
MDGLVKMLSLIGLEEEKKENKEKQKLLGLFLLKV